MITKKRYLSGEAPTLSDVVDLLLIPSSILRFIHFSLEYTIIPQQKPRNKLYKGVLYASALSVDIGRLYLYCDSLLKPLYERLTQ